METIILDLLVKQGSDFIRNLAFKNPDSSNMDLTGYVFRAQARVEITSLTVSFAFVFDTSGAATGNIVMKIPNSQTVPLDLTENVKFVYDAEMESPSGVVARFLQGKIEVSPEVTR